MFIHGKPAGIRQLIFLQPQLATLVVGKKAQHQLVRKWPGLRALVADIGHRQTGFLHHLPGYRLLQILARLDKTGDQTVKITGNPRGSCQQEAVVPANNGNDARGNARVPRDAAPVAPACPFAGMGSGFVSTAAAVTMVLPPLPDRSEEHTSELQSRENLVCRLLLEKKKQTIRA